MSKGRMKEKLPELRDARVLVVDDEPGMLDIVAGMLQGYVAELRSARSCAEALERVREGGVDIALVDVNLTDGNGFDLIVRMKDAHKSMSFIMITGLASDEEIRKLDKLGITTLLTKPFTAMQLRFCISREICRKKHSVRHLNGGRECDGLAEELVGISGYAKELRRKILELAAGDSPVLIQGPTGTGKEIIARTIHRCSARGAKPIMTVNSSAIPEHLEESEFFGYAKGAFTGASQAKDGILRCADGSTLFLDEVGELSLRMQAKLLRVLDGHEFFRVGETAPQRSDFRLISATNRTLQEMIKCGSFREDLFFRLRAALVVTQPIVKHKEDIPSLTNHFLKGMREVKHRDFEFSVDALETLTHYTWPGNIRELKNTVEVLCTAAQDTGIISRESVVWALSESGRGDNAPVTPFSTAKIDFERDYYRTLLIKFNGVISSAARAAGIERAYFSKRIRALGLSKEQFDGSEGDVQKVTR
jgi:DNA-binding NtrC family response regulator